jgi:hypothetical protein
MASKKKKKKKNARNSDSKKKKRNDLKRAQRRKEHERALKTKDLGPIPHREICPAENLSVQEYLKKMKNADPPVLRILKRIREEKHQNRRLMPSSSIVGQCEYLPIETRKILLDKIASLVDENLFGRSEMCIQFAALLEFALKELGLNAQSIGGNAEYKYRDEKWFSWDHAWVIIDDRTIIDGNTDSMKENIMVPDGVSPSPYWGSISGLPDDRRYFPSNLEVVPDSDVDMWWNDLKLFIHEIILK